MISTIVSLLQLSKPIKAEEGKELGLIDEIVPPNQLLSAARRVALDLASGRRPLVKSLERNDKIEELDDALEIIKFARKQARATAPNVNHPQACLDAVEAGVRHGGYEGNRKVRGMEELACIPSVRLSFVSSYFLAWVVITKAYRFLSQLACRRSSYLSPAAEDSEIFCF